MHISYCQLDLQKARNVYTTTNMYLTPQFSIPSMALILIILLIFAIDKYSLSISRFTLHPSAPCSLDHWWAPCPLAFLWSSQWSHWQEIGRQGQSEVNAFILLLLPCWIDGEWPASSYQKPQILVSTFVFQELLLSCFLTSGGKAPPRTNENPGCFIILGWLLLALSTI